MEVAMVTLENDGTLIFRVYLPHAQSVELVADFTHWGEGRMALQREHAPAGRHAEGTPHDHPIEGEFRRGEEDSQADELANDPEQGWWTIRTKAPDGDHAFSYLIDDQWWLPDYAAHGVKRDSEGHWTSLLFVPPTPRLTARLEKRRARVSSETRGQREMHAK
jgi:1,4-alpha-glucan branching enzyme